MNHTITSPLISIVIPHYNCSRYLEKTLISIQRQVYRNIETIIVDDGSIDSEKRIALDLALKYDASFVDLKHNSGLSVARNEGIQKSHGEWLLMLDSDDLLMPKAISNLVSLIRPNDLMISGLLLSVPKNFEYPDNMIALLIALLNRSVLHSNFLRFWKFLWLNHNSQPWRCFSNTSSLYSRDLFRKVGLYDEALRWAEDSEFKERIIRSIGILPKRCWQLIYLYRIHPYQMTKGDKPRNIFYIYRQNLERRLNNGIDSTNTRLLVN